MEHAGPRSLLRSAAVACAMAAPAAAQLTVKPVSGAIELDWLSPDPSNTTITYNILRADGASQPTVVISARPVSVTTYNDPLTTLVLLQPKTYSYMVQAVWPNGTKRLSNLATITLPAAKQVPGGVVTKCLTAFDLPVQFEEETEVSQIVMLHLVVPASSPWPNPMTVTVSNSSDPTRFPNVAFPAKSWQGFYDAYYPNVPGNSLGAVGSQLSLTLDISVSVADAQCTSHIWTTHWTHSGPLH
jgi:hypothetical protein